MNTLRLYILILCWGSCRMLIAQTFIEGKVTDKRTGEPVSYANIYIKGTTIGTTTNDTGYFQLRLNTPYDSISAAYLGYAEQTLPLNRQPKQRVTFLLEPAESMLAEAVIVASKETLEDYLIRKIHEHRPQNDKKHLDNYSYEFYNKIELDIKNISEKLMDRKLLKPFKFVFNNIDSTSEEEPFLPMLLSEKISDFYYTGKLNRKREVVKASKISGVEDASFNEFLNATYQDINIYDNAYEIIGKQFISPIANACKTFYRYKVIDTLVLDNVVHYKMMFEPKTKGDFTFFGSLIVSENNYAIKDIQLRMAPHVNINFIKRIEVNQEFDFVDGKCWMLTKDHLLIEFAPLEKTPAIITRKNNLYRQFRVNQPYNDSMVARLKEEMTMNEAEVKKDLAYWDTARFQQLTKNEAAIYHMIDTLQSLPAYKTYTDIINFIFTGYYKAGTVEWGPILNALSFNQLEGWRFRVGFRTSDKFSERVQAWGYAAYGLRDQRMKGAGGIQILADQSPRQIISASYLHDVSKISRSTDLLSTDNLLNIVILRRKPDIRLLYLDDAKLSYQIEYRPGMTIGATLQNRRIAQGLVPFQYALRSGESVTDTFSSLNQSELVCHARFAIGEKYIYRNSLFRSSVNTSRVPVIHLEYVYGMKGFLKSQFEYHKVSASYTQTIPVRTIGRMDIHLQAGKVFGKVPFLLSELHDGNQTYAYSQRSFNLMNDYEFYSDLYVQWSFCHHFEGFFLNRIPGIRKLKLREVIHTRGVWGQVSATNRELNAPSSTFIRPLGKVPYLEVGFGLENILKIIRWDVMWRLTHRDNPQAYNWIMTFGLDLDF